MATTILNAMIILPDHQSRVTPLRFDLRQVISLDKPPERADNLRDLAGYALYPGLVNAHDHLELNHYPRTKFRDTYANAYDWSADFTPRLQTEPFLSLRRMPLAEQCWIGGLKNLASGVTTVAHHNPLHRPLRQKNFPVRVLSRYGWAHSLRLEKRDLAATYRATPRGAAWFIHLAEGMDSVAEFEARRLHDLGLLRANTVLIHGVGLRDDRAFVAEKSGGLVWCPSTNFYLLGQTTNVSDFAERRKLALGCDSRLTADGDLLDELRAAFATGQVSPLTLFRAVTTDAARMIRMVGAGSLEPGNLPDFFVTPLTEAIQVDPYRALIDLTPAQIDAVWIGGVQRWPGKVR